MNGGVLSLCFLLVRLATCSPSRLASKLPKSQYSLHGRERVPSLNTQQALTKISMTAYTMKAGSKPRQYGLRTAEETIIGSAGVPLFLANGAIAAFIKFYNNTPPAILVAILHGLAVLYLLVAHARWFKHLFAVPERESLEVLCFIIIVPSLQIKGLCMRSIDLQYRNDAGKAYSKPPFAEGHQSGVKLKSSRV